MAESKAKSKASGKPVSNSTETKLKAKTKTTKPAAEKAASKPTVAKPKVAKPKTATIVKRSVKAPMLPISAEQHYRMVAEAAYYIAERRGFAPGDAAADWAQAEKQIVASLKK
ncbi:MAG: DUF2934 domain-containing protein [Sulfuriferula sp.]